MEKKSTYLKILIVCLAITIVGCFWLSSRNSTEPVALTVMPSAPHQGDPVVATYKLNNPTSEIVIIGFQFYANGELVRDGEVSLAPGTSQSYQDIYANPLPIGQQLNFMVKSQSSQGSYEKLVSVPPVPPQVLTSFISFATFSTSIMTSMASMEYYKGNFGASALGANIGIILTLTLLALLIFMELTTNSLQNRAIALGKLKLKYNTLTWILLIIFLGMVYTRIVMIIS